MADDVLSKVKALIAGRVASHATEGDLGAETYLLSAGLNLDSVAVLELVMDVERAFGIELTEQELTVDLLRTVGSLAEAVARKLATDTPTRESA